MAGRKPKGYPEVKNDKPSKFMLETSHYDEAKAGRRQASIVFDVVRQMLEMSSALRLEFLN